MRWIIALTPLICSIILASASFDRADPTPKPRKPTPSPTPIALPSEVKIPAYQPGPLSLHDGEQLTYVASWMAIPAAQAVFGLHRDRKDQSLWDADISVRTNSAIDMLYKLRDDLHERINIQSMQSTGVVIHEQENQRLNQYTIQFDRPDSLVKMEKKNRDGYIKHREFIAADPFGPLSGAMMARTMQFQPGDRVVFDIFTGTQRYVFGFHVDGREKITVPAGTFDAFKVTPDVVYLSDGDARSKVRETYVWVSADDRHLPLRIAVSAWVGTLHADLVKIEGGARPVAKVAQH